MSQVLIARPAPDEYAPYYAAYINKVPSQELLHWLSRQIEEICALLAGISEAKANAAYAPGKWSLKQVVGHMSDTERIMAYRALRIARGDTTPLPGFEQDDYVRAAGFDARSLADLVSEFRSVRSATLPLLASFDAATLERRGTANNMAVSVRALAYIIAGHAQHHADILRTRYLA